MIKQTITYVDYDGNERKEDFWFNLTKAEVIKLDMSFPGGIRDALSMYMKLGQNDKIWGAFEKIIDMSYGVKSSDGRRFLKNPEILASFKETEAYSNLILSFFEENDKAYNFINGLVSGVNMNEVRAAVDKAQANGEIPSEISGVMQFPGATEKVSK